MSKAPKPSSTFLGVALIFVLFSILLLGPKIITQRRFQVPAAGAGQKETSSERISEALSRPLAVLGRGKEVRTLREILKEHPQGVIVNFWATWCAPCLEELPSLDMLGRQLSKNQALPQLVTIAEDDTPTAVTDFFKTLDFKSQLFTVHDRDGGVAQLLGTNKFPETYWIVDNGNQAFIRKKWIGPQNWISEEILRTLARNG